MNYKHGEIKQIYNRLSKRVKIKYVTVWLHIVDGFTEKEIFEKYSKPRTNKYCHTNWTECKLNILTGMYKEGFTLTKIAKEIGVLAPTVRNKLIRLGIYNNKYKKNDKKY